jgi:isoleucyl-tRNA synthetase
LYQVLIRLSVVMAPTTPFIAEEIFQQLTQISNLKSQISNKESVHLMNWPEVSELGEEEKGIIEMMQKVRDVCNVGNSLRREKQLPSKQPLAMATVTASYEKLPDEYLEIIKEELNIKNIDWIIKQEGEIGIGYDITLTPLLIAEGEARKIIRQIQEARKNANVERDSLVSVTLPDWPKEFEEEIKRKAKARELIKGAGLSIILIS